MHVASVPVAEFVQYVGPTTIHDAIVESIELRDGRLLVVLRTDAARGEGAILLQFLDPVVVEQEEPAGMIVYALTELASHDDHRRRFSLVNSDEESTARLELLALDVVWDRYRAS